MTIEESIEKIKEAVFKEIKIGNEFSYLLGYHQGSKSDSEKKIVNDQIDKLKASLHVTNEKLLKSLEETNLASPLPTAEVNVEQLASQVMQGQGITRVKYSGKREKDLLKREKISDFEKETLKRLKKKKDKGEVKKEEAKTNEYAKLAGGIFGKIAKNFIKQKKFKKVGEDLIKSNLNYNIITYVSTMLLNTAIAFGLAFLLFIFLLFFDISPTFPIITMAKGDILMRILTTFWIMIVAPAGTFLFMYTYPSLEKKSLEGKINAELPFAMIHMSAISGSMIDPIKIFSIIGTTKEYPHLEKEFNKLLNEINVYGYDLVTALKDLAIDSPSQKLSDFFNGLATTITSGGSLFEYFGERAQGLLFDYKLDNEKATKSAETFMDIYISVVIAAPMVLMLLLMMMKVSGLGISLSTNMISLLVAGGVSMINVLFLVFLQVKQQSTS
jgi:archaeal flagellar protein FlaJ